MKTFYILTATLSLFCAFTWLSIGGSLLTCLILVGAALWLLEEFASDTTSRPKSRERTAAEHLVSEDDEATFQYWVAVNTRPDSPESKAYHAELELRRQEQAKIFKATRHLIPNYNPMARDEEEWIPVRQVPRDRDSDPWSTD